MTDRRTLVAAALAAVALGIGCDGGETLEERIDRIEAERRRELRWRAWGEHVSEADVIRTAERVCRRILDERECATKCEGAKLIDGACWCPADAPATPKPAESDEPHEWSHRWSPPGIWTEEVR